MRKLLSSVLVIGALWLAGGGGAASADSGYGFFGDASLVSPGESSPHAAQATSAGTSAFGGVDFAVPAGLTVAGLSRLSTDAMFTGGSSCGSGSPRFAVAVTNGTDSGNLFFYLGPPPNYTGCPSGSWTASGNLADPANLVDSSQLAGGTFYEPYSAVQAAYGDYTVQDIALVVDGSAQTVRFDDTRINDTLHTYDPTCTPTGFVRDGMNLTAAQIGGDVTGPLDAAGCNIGVYYDSTHTGKVAGADISGANYFGVLVNGDSGSVSVNVTGSSIHDIGETPPNGAQHGNAIYYRAFGGTASGTISGNTVTRYQKNGITAVGSVTASIANNTVMGAGPVPSIAQNGIEVGLGATGSVSGNAVSENAYSGTNNASSGGILVFGGACYGGAYSTSVSITKNTLTNNDVGVFISNLAGDCSSTSPTATRNAVVNNVITDGHETNVSGNGSPNGYQAGVSDVGNHDNIVNDTISGDGYNPANAPTPGSTYTKVDTSGSTRPHVNNIN